MFGTGAEGFSGWNVCERDGPETPLIRAQYCTVWGADTKPAQIHLQQLRPLITGRNISTDGPRSYTHCVRYDEMAGRMSQCALHSSGRHSRMTLMTESTALGAPPQTFSSSCFLRNIDCDSVRSVGEMSFSIQTTELICKQKADCKSENATGMSRCECRLWLMTKKNEGLVEKFKQKATKQEH